MSASMLIPLCGTDDRFEVQIRIDYPDRQGREEIFHIHTREMAAAGFLHPGVSLPYLANATSSFSGADIAGVVRDASAHALSRSFASSAERAMAVHTPALFQVWALHCTRCDCTSNAHSSPNIPIAGEPWRL